jgi:diguanylate cyclase (GGDEF)-like protein/PAS domain S-box-containing protein
MRLTMRKYDFLSFTDRRFERLFHLNPAAILMADLNGQIKEANPAARQLFNSIAVRLDNLWSIVDTPLRALVERRQEIKNYEMTIDSGGKRIDVLIDGGYILVEHRPHLVFIFRDVTEFNEQRKKIAHLAYHDPLTGLPNRRHFQEKLQARLEAPDGQNRKLAVVLVDADNFKTVNDRYGHQAGDDVLVKIALLLRGMAESEGLAARLGGDEFVVYLDGVPDAAHAEDWVVRLLERFAQLKAQNEPTMSPVSLSIGISLFPAHGRTIDELLNQADKALYAVKREGKNHYRVQSSGTS